MTSLTVNHELSRKQSYLPSRKDHYKTMRHFKDVILKIKTERESLYNTETKREN